MKSNKTRVQFRKLSMVNRNKQQKLKKKNDNNMD